MMVSTKKQEVEHKMKIYRQGDVLLMRVTNVMLGAAIPRDGGRVVLAYGEVTGHAHALLEPEAELYELAEDHTADGDATWARADRILRVTGKAAVALRHEEHAPISLRPGTYRVRIQREFDPSTMSRQVAD